MIRPGSFVVINGMDDSIYWLYLVVEISNGMATVVLAVPYLRRAFPVPDAQGKYRDMTREEKEMVFPIPVAELTPAENVGYVLKGLTNG